LLAHYQEINRENASKFAWETDFVMIHDPQPAWLINEMRPQARHWIWRCHIDVSRPNRRVWKYLREIVSRYDASVFSMAKFAQNLPHHQYIIRPAIDPLSEKNRDLTPEEIQRDAAVSWCGRRTPRRCRCAWFPPGKRLSP
jgi:trehalose synthase